MQGMTPRERMLAAIRNEIPDRVPVAPDISNMIPCRLTGKPFWDIYYFNDPPLWKAYLAAVDHFGIDGWFTYGSMQFQFPGDRSEIVEDMQKTAERWTVRSRLKIAGLTAHHSTAYYRADPPTALEKPIKDLKADWALVKALFAPPTGYDPALVQEQRKALGEKGALGICTGCPGFHTYHWFIDGGLEAIAVAYYDERDLFLEMNALLEKRYVKEMEMILEVKPDFVLTGGSGAITMSSPKLVRELYLPTLKKQTAMARAAGVPTMVHCCGKEAVLVKWAAEETDLSCINPLEVPPMGDCNLAELKRRHGAKISLMGNLHTTALMLRGSARDVRRASLQAILDAGENGGFILSTGDQCGRDTPDENIRAMVQAAEEFGRYPLDLAAIRDEIGRLT